MRNRYIFLRHGETIFQTKKDDFLYPWVDFVTKLTKKGEEQIKIVARKLIDKKVDLIFSSDFLRTKQTAEIVARELDLKIRIDKRLRDLNWGIYQDGPVKEYLRFFFSEKQRFSKGPAKGESWRDVKKRMLDFIKEIDKNYKNKTILIISHGDPLWLLYGTLKGLNEKQLLKRRHNKNFYPDVGQCLEL